MTTLAPRIFPAAPQLSDVDGTDNAGRASQRQLLILGGLSGVAAGLAYFAAQAIPWDHDLPVEVARWEAILGFWTILAVAPFAIVIRLRALPADRLGA